MNAPRFRAVSAALLIATVALGVWLRVRRADDSLWLDELHTAWVVEGQGSELVARAALGNQSPLFYFAVAGVQRVLGPSELSLRLLSLTAGSLLPLAVYLLTRRLLCGDEKHREDKVSLSERFLPLLAAWLAAVDPTAIFYATEARPYACVQLLAVVHVALLTELVRRPTYAIRAAWIAVGALLFYLHYTAGLLLVAEGVFLAWIALRRSGEDPEKVSFGQVLSDFSILALLMAPAIAELLAIHERRSNWALFIERVGLEQLASLPTFIPWSAAALYFIVAWAVSCIVAQATSNPLSPRERVRVREARSTNCSATSIAASTPTALLLTWLLIPIALVALSTSLDWLRLWHVRYLIAVTPAALMLAAMLPRLVTGRGAIVVAVSLALAAGYISHQSLNWSDARGFALRGEDWRSAVAWLNENRVVDEPILLRAGLIECDSLRTSDDEGLREYCKLPLTSLYRLKAGLSDIVPLTMTRPGDLSDSLRDELAPPRGETRRFLLVARGSPERAQDVVAQLRQTFARANVALDVEAEQPFGRAQVLRLRLNNNR